MSTCRAPLSGARSTLLSAALAAVLAGPALAGPATVPTDFADTALASSLNLPTSLAEVPDPAALAVRRVLFVEQGTARVQLLIGGSVSLVGTVPGVVYGGERGLLGCAIDPAWPSRPYLYIHATDGRSGNHIAISRFTLTGDLAGTGSGLLQFDAASRYDLRADLPDNAGNHNGGSVRFGPDGMLYVSLGDDGQGCPAQDPAVGVGKILRLDVTRLPGSGAGPAPYALLTAAGNPYATSADSVARLVYVVGLRNPFRFSIDPATGALAIGDVGENTWEELDYVPNGGMDLGWPIYEGPDPHLTCAITPPATLTGPIAAYAHPAGYAIMGGPLYRRPSTGSGRFPAEYDGDIFYFDYYYGQMLRVKKSGSSWVPAPAPGQPNPDDWATGLASVADMIELSDGALLYCRQSTGISSSGEIRRIAYTGSVAVPPPAGTPSLALAPPRPNPVRSGAVFEWTQPRAGHVKLAIFAADGHRVRTLVDELAPAGGPQQRAWDGLDERGHRPRSGVYFARLELGGESRSRRLTLLR